MARINEKKASEEFVRKLSTDALSLECAKNDVVNYNEEKEERDTLAVRESTESKLFKKFKELG